MADYKELIAKCEEWIAKADNFGADDLANHISRCADAIEQLVKERDAEPVRHGHWVLRIHDEDDDGGYPLYHCSMCDNPRPHKRDNYCPNCGAKMDEVSE